MQRKSELRKQALKNLHIEQLNEMQKAALKASQTDQDLVLLSPTGSGKTLGFLLPLLEVLVPDKAGVQALILAPSRELALQIEQVFRSMGTGFKVNCCYGGHSMKTEKNNLSHPPAVLIGTPGRIGDHLRRGHFATYTIQTLVLDEFDKALEFGFKPEMQFIISQLQKLKKRVLTSATQAIEIPAFAGLCKPVELNYLQDESPAGLTVKSVEAEGRDKLEALFRLICKLGNAPMLVFCNHRDAVERISLLLSDAHLVHAIFHGGMEQEDRERALIKFRNGSHHILITTDLAARGLDIPEIQYIIHYQLPSKIDAFVHRNGRTARMHASGTSYLVLGEGEPAPAYLETRPEMESLPTETLLPEEPEWATLFIGGGKKDKINKIDIVGFLLQKGQLDKTELGLIEVGDKSAFAAVKRTKIKKVLSLLRNERIKKKKVKIAISR